MRDMIIAWLVWLSADPVALDAEYPKAAATVAARAGRAWPWRIRSRRPRQSQDAQTGSACRERRPRLAHRPSVNAGGAVGDALDTLTLRGLSRRSTQQVGPPAAELEHTCDVIVAEICRVWPERTMADIAARKGTSKAADEAVDAVKVTVAKTRENIEARWGCKPGQGGPRPGAPCLRN
jgi:hypothetical protein